MKTFFRSVEFWKSAMLTMPDNSFFELLRNIFGKIKTPFNKQQLINDLNNFLLRDDIQKKICAYIDHNDAKIIAAAALFGEPAIKEIESFFSGEYSYAHLQDIIVNLEERFILYRFNNNDSNLIALNPVLEQILLPFTADFSLLFPAIAETANIPKLSAEQTHSSLAVLNDRILAALLSFTAQVNPFFRTEGVIRKSVIEAGKKHFPGIDLGLVIGALQILGLFSVEKDNLVYDNRRFNDFGSLSAQERSEYYTAALLICRNLKSQSDTAAGKSNDPAILPPVSRSRIHETVKLIHSLLDSLEDGLLYPEKTLKKLLEYLKKEINAEIENGLLLETLEETGLLVKRTQEFSQLSPAEKTQTKKHDGPFIAIDAGSSIIVYPEISYDDVIYLAFFLNIREAGAIVSFEINKDAAVRAFDKSISADEIVEILKRLSCGRIDDSLVWNLKDWEKRHREISLKRGVVLSLSEDRRYLVETRSIAKIIRETLASGIYLLDEDAMEEAANTLRIAGIDIFARDRGKITFGKNRTDYYNYFPSPVSSGLLKKITPAVNAVSPDSAAALTENFHAVLQKISVTDSNRAELSARIDRKLILCEEQLKEADIRYEKLEARHLDYMGKQNIARQAIAQQSPVEIVWLGSGERIFGIPKTLDKEGKELILVVAPDGEGGNLRIPLGKISLLRRIKKSIFEK